MITKWGNQRRTTWSNLTHFSQRAVAERAGDGSCPGPLLSLLYFSPVALWESSGMLHRPAGTAGASVRGLHTATSGLFAVLLQRLSAELTAYKSNPVNNSKERGGILLPCHKSSWCTDISESCFWFYGETAGRASKSFFLCFNLHTAKRNKNIRRHCRINSYGGIYWFDVKAN